MSKILILLFIFSGQILAQTDSYIKYYNDTYLSKKVANGPYKLEIIQVNDSISTSVFSKTKNDQKIWTKTYLKSQPYGIWESYDKKGNLESTLNYNFILMYGEFIPNNAVKFSDLGIDLQSDSNNLKIQNLILKEIRYPETAMDNGLEGKVTLQFTIDENGNVDHLRILEGVHISLDTESFRVMNTLKKLDSYEKDGKKILVYYTIPIKFKLSR